MPPKPARGAAGAEALAAPAAGLAAERRDIRGRCRYARRRRAHALLAEARTDAAATAARGGGGNRPRARDAARRNRNAPPPTWRCPSPAACSRGCRRRSRRRRSCAALAADLAGPARACAPAVPRPAKAVEVASAVPLEAPAPQACRAMLAGAGEIAFATDPALIAGVELAPPTRHCAPTGRPSCSISRRRSGGTSGGRKPGLCRGQGPRPLDPFLRSSGEGEVMLIHHLTPLSRRTLSNRFQGPLGPWRPAGRPSFLPSFPQEPPICRDRPWLGEATARSMWCWRLALERLAGSSRSATASPWSAACRTPGLASCCALGRPVRLCPDAGRGRIGCVLLDDAGAHRGRR